MLRPIDFAILDVLSESSLRSTQQVCRRVFLVRNIPNRQRAATIRTWLVDLCRQGFVSHADGDWQLTAKGAAVPRQMASLHR